ncbi:MAG: HAMP domain-containing protein [Planctomycetes bacterium]|nr:HAMP domain-containing protein [Planctomycetota bacterium]
MPTLTWLRVFTVCLLPIATLFLGYEIVERVWLGSVDPELLHLLRILRWLCAAVISAALATVLLLRWLRGSSLDEPALPVSTKGWRRRLQHVRVRTKIVVPMVILAVVPAIFVGLFTISSVRVALRTTAVERLEFDAASRARAIREFLEGVRGDLSFVSELTPIRELAGAGTSLTAEQLNDLRRVAQRELAIFAHGKRGYYQIRYLDDTGSEVIRLNIDKGQVEIVPPEQLQDKGDRYYVREALALEPGETYVSPMDLNVEHGQAELPDRGVVRYAARVRGLDGRGCGLVVINLYADYVLSLLAPLPTGTEAWLVDKDGTYLGYVGKSEVGRKLFKLGQRRRISQDFSVAETSAILEHPPAQSILDTSNAFVSSTRIEPGGGAEARWTLLVAYPRAPIDTPIHQLTAFLSIVLMCAVLAAGVLGVLMGSYLARPIMRLRRATREIAAGDLSRYVDVTTGDELEGLASDFNAMTKRLLEARARVSAWNEKLEQEVARQTDDLHQLQTALARADKLASIGQMTAGVMHEVGNPLAAIKTKIQVAEEDSAMCSNCQSLCGEILLEVDRLTMFLRSFSRLGRTPEPCMEVVSIAEVVEGVTTLVTPELRRRGISLRTASSGETPTVRGDVEQLRHLLMNLILNAMEASSQNDEIVVDVRHCSMSGEKRVDHGSQSGGTPVDGVRIQVIDRGSGIPPKIVDRIWDPFFTTRSEGTGLGLSICRGIVEDHRGTIQVRSDAGNGTIFTLMFPACKVEDAGETDARKQARLDRSAVDQP